MTKLKAYTRQNYSTCKVHFSKFFPYQNGVSFACGIRANEVESENLVEKGIAIRTGNELAADPDDDLGLRSHKVEFVGTALVVRDNYKPEYQWVKSNGGNHVFRIPVTVNREFEYLIAGAWSEGVVYNTPESFKAYVKQTALEYNNPVKASFGRLENKDSGQ